MVSGVLRGLGDSKRPMYFVLVACIINIVGDLLLVGVFGLGAAGAALATVAAQGVSLALALAVLRRRDFPFDFKRRSFRIQGDKAARILRLGLPVAVQNVLVTLVFTLNGFYSGCGRTGFTLFNSLASTFLVRVPAVFFISLLPGVTLLHIGVAAPAASAVQVLLQLLYFRTGRWNHSVLGEAQT